MNKQCKRYDNSFLFYNNPMDWDENIPDSKFLQVINPYQYITKTFGAKFVERVRKVGFEVFNLQRLGSIDQTLHTFDKCKGFDKLIKNMSQIASLIEQSVKDDEEFQEHFNQLLRYFSELLFPNFLLCLCNGKIEFQPKDIGKGLKSCDNTFSFKGNEINIEITTINTKEIKNLRSKVIDIFEIKVQEQLNKEKLGLLVIDITASGTQNFDFNKHKFYVEFPIFDVLAELVNTELAKEENKHLIGVAFVGNILTEKEKKIAITWNVIIKENKKNPYSKLIKEILNDKK